MKKHLVGIIIGAIAGIIDVIPMVLQKLTWDANISAMSMWIIAGFLISSSSLKLPYILKGIIYPFLVFIPAGILIGWKEPMTLIPITIMTLILGTLLGLVIGKLNKNKTA